MWLSWGSVTSHGPSRRLELFERNCCWTEKFRRKIRPKNHSLTFYDSEIICIVIEKTQKKTCFCSEKNWNIQILVELGNLILSLKVDNQEETIFLMIAYFKKARTKWVLLTSTTLSNQTFWALRQMIVFWMDRKNCWKIAVSCPRAFLDDKKRSGSTKRKSS